MTFFKSHIGRCQSAMVQGKRIGASPYQEITKREFSHSGGKVQWAVTLRINGVKSSRCNEATNFFLLTRNHHANFGGRQRRAVDSLSWRNVAIAAEFAPIVRSRVMLFRLLWYRWAGS